MNQRVPKYQRILHWVSMATLAWFMIDLGFAPDAFAQPSNQLRYVREPKTPVRCGPGEDFYVASYLKQGAAVEVYHRTKEGWCGIRPPEGSACWLAAENAYLLPGGTSAEIVGKKTPAWIAAAEGNPKQLRWQIELQPSQQVKVLGEAKQVIDSETERLWYRIAPPQGEFSLGASGSVERRTSHRQSSLPPIDRVE